MAVVQKQQLDDLNRYLFSRVWPRRYGPLEDAFHNFSRVLNDLRIVFMMHGAKREGDETFYETQKFYHQRDESNGLAARLLDQYNYHVDLVEDLLLELTRAANAVCDEVRRSISPSFRLHEGVLLVVSGPDMNLRFTTHRTEYRDEGRYPGLREFMTIRSRRDLHFGEGVDESYFPSKPWDVDR
jgi:hypothetical protein